MSVFKNKKGSNARSLKSQSRMGDREQEILQMAKQEQSALIKSGLSAFESSNSIIELLLDSVQAVWRNEEVNQAQIPYTCEAALS